MRRAWERWYGTALHPRWVDDLSWWLFWRSPVTRRKALGADTELTDLNHKIDCLQVAIAVMIEKRWSADCPLPLTLSPRAAAMIAEARRQADQAREPLTAVKGGGCRSAPRRPSLHLVAEVER